MAQRHAASLKQKPGPSSGGGTDKRLRAHQAKRFHDHLRQQQESQPAKEAAEAVAKADTDFAFLAHLAHVSGTADEGPEGTEEEQGDEGEAPWLPGQFKAWVNGAFTRWRADWIREQEGQKQVEEEKQEEEVWTKKHGKAVAVVIGDGSLRDNEPSQTPCLRELNRKWEMP
ncbi:hypothetical protein ColLi_09114 [Colletotrichum liriopes]|uniref:Uncharacterized protein n=1 Tax=Colletotrichum liriopes TaxID=708192 RepID=A0AA37LW09_9PEZI|nr:hypothetical protein ColLi_09114 [Colletotrichum liriopes]